MCFSYFSRPLPWLLFLDGSLTFKLGGTYYCLRREVADAKNLELPLELELISLLPTRAEAAGMYFRADAAAGLRLMLKCYWFAAVVEDAWGPPGVFKVLN